MRNILALSFLLVATPFLKAQDDVIAVSWSGAASTIDSLTGMGNPLGSTGSSSLNAMATDPVSGDVFVGGSGGSLYTVDPATGIATFVTGTTLASIRGMAFDPSGTLYALENAGGGIGVDDLYTLDPLTGIATLVGSTQFFGMQAMAWHDGTLYAWECGNGGGTGIGLCTIDPSNASVLDVGAAIGTCNEVQALLSDGTLYAVRDSFYSTNPDGSLTLIGSGGYTDVRGADFINTSCSLTLSNPIPGIAGTTNSVTFTCASPNAQVAIVHSLQAGSTPVAVCPGLSVDMMNPLLLGIFGADAAGNGSASGFAPPALSGQTSLIQAVDITGCTKSNLVMYPWP